MTELSLFDGDPFRRVLKKIGFVSEGKIRYRFLAPAVIAIGYLVPLALVACERHIANKSLLPSFLLNFNPPVQTIVVLILLVAEPFIDEHVRNAGGILSNSDLLMEPSEYERAAKVTARLRKLVIPEIIALLISVAFNLLWVLPAVHNGATSYVSVFRNGHMEFTLAGWWTAIFFGPLLQFLWVRWAWKYFIWTHFLYRIARAKLRLAAGHPDQVGGLAFIGELQGMFGILIFAIGMIVVADFTQSRIENYQRAYFLATIGGFIIFAPLTFLAPLLMFTKKLYEAKRAGLAKYEILLTQFINAFEKKHLREERTGLDHLSETEDLADLSCIENLHSHVAKMRIVPFDLISLFRLIMAAIAPMIPLFIRFIPWPGIRRFIETLFGH